MTCPYLTRFGLERGAGGEWVPGQGAGLCGVVVRREKAAAHEAGCGWAPVGCEYEGCGAVVVRGAMARHYREEVGAHLELERAARVRQKEEVVGLKE